MSGKWKGFSYVTAKVSDSPASSRRYAKSFSLSAKGEWRLRAHHPAATGHAASWSKGHDYVTLR